MTRPSPRRGERGSAAIEVAIGAPVMLMLVALVVFGGRIALARQSVTVAAESAARAASISRSATAASSSAERTARDVLADAGCRSVEVSVDARAFASPPGTPGSVHATVTCHVDLAGLPLAAPDGLALTDTGSSALDTYRGRR